MDRYTTFTHLRCLAISMRLAATILLVLPAFASGKEGLDEVIAGMRSNRSELKSGQYSVSISETYSSGRKTTERAECTFDFAAESLRFDRELNDAVGKRNWKFISTPGFACKWLVEEVPSAITIERPSETSDTGALDPRVVGLLLPAERFHYFQLDELWAALFEGEAEKLLLPDGGNGKQQISIIGGKNKEMRRLLTMDASRGYTIESLIFEHRSGDVWSGPQISIKTSWDRKENVWVPKTCQIEDKYASRSIRIDFTWKEVNTKISDKLFDIHAFHLPKGTLVCDKRLGFVMITEKIGDESFKPRPAKPEAPGP